MLSTLWHVFLAFFRSSILSYGGGPSSIPLMRKEVVDTFKLLPDNQFADALAMGNTLPGPIAPKMAAYIGYHVAGITGAVVGIVAVVVPTAVAIVLIAQLLLHNKDNPRMISMLKIAKPIVVVLLLQATFDLMGSSSNPNTLSYIMYALAFAAVIIMLINSHANIAMYIVSAVAFAAVIIFGINPAIVMLAGLVIGFSFYRLFLI